MSFDSFLVGGTKLPEDVITFNPLELTYEIYTTDVYNDGQVYNVYLEVTVNDTAFNPQEVRYVEKIYWKLNLVFFPYNEPPSIPADKRPKNIVVNINQVAEYHSGPPSADTANSVFKCDDKRFFEFVEISYDKNHGANLLIKPTKTENIGQFNVKLTINDYFEFGDKYVEYQFFVIVTIPKGATIDIYDKLKKDEVDEEGKNMTKKEYPVPKMSYKGIDLYGAATFEFDLDMIVDPKFKQIKTGELLSIIDARIIPGIN